MWRQNEEDDEKDEEWCRTRNESKATVCRGGEHTGIGRGCRGPPQCSAVHEKTERRNKTQTNMPTVNKEMTEWRCTQHGIVGAAVSAACYGSGGWDGGQTGDRSKIVAAGHANWCLEKKTQQQQQCNCFQQKGRKDRKVVDHCLFQSRYWISLKYLTEGSAVFIV